MDNLLFIKAQRDRLLFASDWTQLPDSPVDSAAWAVYRQQLRDFPATLSSVDLAGVISLDNLDWPKKPT